MAVDDARELLERLARQLQENEERTRPIPNPSPRLPHSRLCVGMAAFGDFDATRLTIQCLRLAHRDVLDKISFFVVDNHPEGEGAPALRDMADTVPNLRYLPFRGFRGTAVHDLLFLEADADIVLCLDSYVLLRPGALRALLEYFGSDPESLDLVQGPLLDDALEHPIGTHFAARWEEGNFGQWETDERILDPGCGPFEIPMQGLGVFACRTGAWPGINPRFRGFGGEDGYLHERFRRNGGRVVCLPQLAWWRPYARPISHHDRQTWEDRIRNYHIGWAELGWDPEPIDAHFRELLSADGGGTSISRVQHQLRNPFMFFDGLFCVARVGHQTEMQQRFKLLDIDWRVEWTELLEEGEGGQVEALRSVIEAARDRGYRHFVVVEDDAVFIDQTLDVMAEAVGELAELEWDLVLLGGAGGPAPYAFAGDSLVLQKPGGLRRATALAVNASIYDRLLADLTEDNIEPSFDDLLSRQGCQAFVTLPRVASCPSLLEDQDRAMAGRYII